MLKGRLHKVYGTLLCNEIYILQVDYTLQGQAVNQFMEIKCS